MSDSNYSRRDVLLTVAVAGASGVTSYALNARSAPAGNTPSATSAKLAAKRPASVVVLAGNHTVLPLPFVATALNGISDRMITSHHDNNYAGAVRNLNRVEQELAKITADTPAFVVAALREKELTFRNSKTLHEAYFANLGGNGKRSGPIDGVLGHAYGSTARWEEHFRVSGMGLGGGSGWVILYHELESGELRTVAASSHTQALLNGYPLLVLDMYEHAYQMDFGAGAGKYIDAFFTNVKWEEVNRRLERAHRAFAELHDPSSRS
jgi:Fe-Mn family superoxide dismutase